MKVLKLYNRIKKKKIKELLKMATIKNIILKTINQKAIEKEILYRKIQGEREQHLAKLSWQ